LQLTESAQTEQNRLPKKSLTSPASIITKPEGFMGRYERPIRVVLALGAGLFFGAVAIRSASADESKPATFRAEGSALTAFSAVAKKRHQPPREAVTSYQPTFTDPPNTPAGNSGDGRCPNTRGSDFPDNGRTPGGRGYILRAEVSLVHLADALVSGAPGTRSEADSRVSPTPHIKN
jgi:hypothetical protein